MTGPEATPPEPIGALLARIRTGRGISQLRLAELLCAASGVATVTRHEVSRWERGERVPGGSWLRWLAAVLELPVGQLEQAARLARMDRRTTTPPAAATERPLWTMSDAGSLTRLLDEGATDLSRLAHDWLAQQRSGAQPTALPLPRTAGLPAPPDLEVLDNRLADLRRTDDLVGGADLAGIALGELRAVLDLLRTHRPTRRLLGAVAGAAQLAGWTAADAGQPEAAQRAYGVGMSAATAAGDRALGAHLLGCLSHLVAERDPPEALLLARTAYAGARHAGGGGLQALLLHRIAFAAALTGERRSSESALAAAERVADRREPARERTWLYWLDAAELTALTGRCFAALRRPLRAEPLLRQRFDPVVAGAAPTARAVTRAPTGPRTTAIDGGWLAEAYLDAGEVEQACSVATLALQAAIRSGSPRATGRAMVVHRRLLTTAGAGPAAREYAGLVRAARPYLPRPGSPDRRELDEHTDPTNGSHFRNG